MPASERVATVTGKLRFIERVEMVPLRQFGPDVAEPRKVRILQQEFTGRDGFSGATFTEWRDVPLVAEGE